MVRNNVELRTSVIIYIIKNRTQRIINSTFTDRWTKLEPGPYDSMSVSQLHHKVIRYRMYS